MEMTDSVSRLLWKSHYVDLDDIGGKTLAEEPVTGCSGDRTLARLGEKPQKAMYGQVG